MNQALMDNSEMSLIKTFMPLTSEISEHPVFGDIWQRINAEYKLTSTNLLLLGNHTTLMEEYPVDKLSIQMREKIMIPLATIQQYGLSKLREMDNSGEEELSNSYQKMIIRCAFGIINGGRNSA